MRHLPGKHDQSTHGKGGGSAKAGAAPATPSVEQATFSIKNGKEIGSGADRTVYHREGDYFAFKKATSKQGIASNDREMENYKETLELGTGHEKVKVPTMARVSDKVIATQFIEGTPLSKLPTPDYNRLDSSAIRAAASLTNGDWHNDQVILDSKGNLWVVDLSGLGSEWRHMPGKHNQKKHGDGTGKATGTGSDATVTLGGKKYKIGDRYDVNGKEHHIADITGDKVVVRPGKAPAVTRKPVSKKQAISTVDSTPAKVTNVTVAKSPAEAKAYVARQNLPEPKGHAKEALQIYSDREYSAINGDLRVGRDPGQTEFDMQKHMKRSTLKESVRVSRAVDSGMFKGDPSKYVGVVIQDKAYLSTSLIDGGPVAAKKFWNAKDTIMDIDVPAGTKAVAMESLTRVKGEHELLIDKGSKMRIKEVTKEGGKWRVKAELVP